MDADVAGGRETPARGYGKWIALGGVTLAAMVLAALALDDITTDNATAFPAEYRVLAACGAWLMIVARELVRSGSRMNAAITLVSVAAATWVAMAGIGHKRDGGWAAFWPQYLILMWAWIHGIVVGILLIRRGMRTTGSG
jgi:hypothetical protein